ncbi:MAG: IgGFc-binding protein [Nannocystaceae bacterium]
MTHKTLSLGLLTVACALAACGDDGGVTTATSTDATTDGSSSQVTTAGTSDATTSPTTAGSESESESTSEATDPTTSPTDPTTEPTTETTDSTDPTTEPTDVTSETETDSDATTDALCPDGTLICEDGIAKVCDGMGGYSEETPCDEECADDLGCVLCIPGESKCEGDEVQVCNDLGDGYVPGDTCDPLQGLSCDEGLGQCVGACANLGLSYIGCDYYPTVTLQHDGYNTAPGNEFAIAVANTSNAPADVTITQGANTIDMLTVQPDSVAVVVLPWVNALTKGHGPTAKVVDGAYRLRSTQPVTVYQFNPLNSTTTNDASLLLPVNTWRNDYLVASWPHWVDTYPSTYAVVASEDGTTVSLTPSATGGQVQAGAGVAANGTGQVTLDEGDVLQVTSAAGDLTGTIVSSDKPVQVFGGHECTNIPLNIAACDHLEESMFPIETLAKEYIVVPPVQIPNDNLDKAQVVRVIASEDNTQLVFEPDQGVNTNLAKAGDFVEMSLTTAAFKVSSEKKILVAQYMVGQAANFGTSDPAYILAVPQEQYRTSYLFFAATNWTANYVDIIAPANASVTVDGVMVNTWSPIAATGFSVAHVKLSNAGDGSHTVESNQKVGISVYGVQSSGSYWYTGGLDLNLIPQ